MSGIPQTPGAARQLVHRARGRERLHPNEWNLIEDYLSELVAKGVTDPQDAADRLERRGRAIAGIHDETFAFPPGGRRRHDSKVQPRFAFRRPVTADHPRHHEMCNDPMGCHPDCPTRSK